MHPVLSVVVPVYNEEDVLPLLVDRLRPVLDGTGVRYEVVAVDDGSTDASAVIMQRIRRTWPEFRIVRLRANAGHQAAISAGLARAYGDYMVTIDADLQDPPEVIADMLAKARDEHLDVVYGVRNDRSTDTAFKRGTAQAFYATMRRLSGSDAPANAGDFRLMSRATVDAVNALPEHHRVLRLVVPALGFPSGEVYYKRASRAAGESKYPLSKMIALSVDSLTAGSMAPLRLATWAGLIGVLGALTIIIYALFSSASGRAIAGWTSTVMVVSAVGAAQLISLGILGEYVGRMYSMMQGRPTYFVAHDTAGDTGRDFTSELDDDAGHHEHEHRERDGRHEQQAGRSADTSPARAADAATRPGDAHAGAAAAEQTDEEALAAAARIAGDEPLLPAGPPTQQRLLPEQPITAEQPDLTAQAVLPEQPAPEEQPVPAAAFEAAPAVPDTAGAHAEPGTAGETPAAPGYDAPGEETAGEDHAGPAREQAAPAQAPAPAAASPAPARYADEDRYAGERVPAELASGGYGYPGELPRSAAPAAPGRHAAVAAADRAELHAGILSPAQAAQEYAPLTARAGSDGNGSAGPARVAAVVDAEARQRVRRTSAKRLTPGSDDTGR